MDSVDRALALRLGYDGSDQKRNSSDLFPVAPIDSAMAVPYGSALWQCPSQQLFFTILCLAFSIHQVIEVPNLPRSSTTLSKPWANLATVCYSNCHWEKCRALQAIRAVDKLELHMLTNDANAIENR